MEANWHQLGYKETWLRDDQFITTEPLKLGFAWEALTSHLDTETRAEFAIWLSGVHRLSASQKLTYQASRDQKITTQSAPPPAEAVYSKVVLMHGAMTFGRKGILDWPFLNNLFVLPPEANVYYDDVINGSVGANELPFTFTLKSIGPIEGENLADLTALQEIHGYGAEHPEENDVPRQLLGSEIVESLAGSTVECHVTLGRFLVAAQPIAALSIGDAHLEIKTANRYHRLATGKNQLHTLSFVQHTGISFKDIIQMLSKRLPDSEKETYLQHLTRFLYPRLRYHPRFAAYQIADPAELDPWRYLAFLCDQDLDCSYEYPQVLNSRDIRPAHRHQQNKYFEGFADLENWRFAKVQNTEQTIRNAVRDEVLMSLDLIQAIAYNLTTGPKRAFLAELLPKLGLLSSARYTGESIKQAIDNIWAEGRRIGL